MWQLAENTGESASLQKPEFMPKLPLNAVF